MNLIETEINDRGYTIREIKLADAERYQSLLLHKDVKPFIPEQLLPNTIFDAIRIVTSLKALSATNTGAYWAICNEDNKLIGSAGFESWSQFHKRLEIAFELHPDYQGQGIMTQALTKIIAFGFENMQAERIEAFTLTHNKPSMHLLKRMGFEHEATLKKYRMFNKKISDIHLFALTK
ncbi:GNAT family N-acetyltransferase [Candidatus Synchoanobacter obligatus]|uniref:GNAT family N-acetyltransferase n=1 Tax=Candidatus Synchoanobacter obligatus TaxID=2919597 RepID=A0ABT1L3N6_9GAMM|nr:GNAT family protein [Candidatus Synchoanobacter obligatus]MCP8351812.1 GNAT family N-acetyltransferase [Candidatus Synchoanobacter obligatus]